MKLLIFTLAIFLTINLSSGKIFQSTCELGKELLKQGFKKETLADWCCLIHHESACNTACKKGPNADKSYNCGLYQIHDKWCLWGKAGGECNVKCEDLLRDDITIASTCAKKVHARHKFSAWNGHRDNCVGKLTKWQNEVNACKF